MTNRAIFLQHLAPTSPAPVGIEITQAEGCYLYDADGNAYIDLISGISVSYLGHGNAQVVKAVQEQVATYMHLMVYGELIQSPQTQYAKLLTRLLPESLNCVYFTNSGSEATEGAIKLAKRLTGRAHIFACHNSYHGSTTGALSLSGSEYWRQAFRPLMPGVSHFAYNSPAMIEAINSQTAAVVIETVQAEAGVIVPDAQWLQELRARCHATNTLLIMDEIQCGFGRTGTLWGWQKYNVVPDIMLLSKALGGGMPLGAFIASYEKMSAFTQNPVLGHITTFGGHPVSCAAGYAALQVLLQEGYISTVEDKALLFRQLLQHPAIKAVRTAGLLIAVELESEQKVQSVIAQCLQKGIFTDWFLFAPHCIRIAPPLIITAEEIEKACLALLSCL